jgi:hypothetical protein
MISPSGISEHRYSNTEGGEIYSSHASLFTVAASAIQIECLSSDDDEDGPRSDVSICVAPAFRAPN